MRKTLSLPPLGLYIHIPWCLKKCPYCDFNSHARQDELPEAAYIGNLLADLAGDAALIQNRKLSSVFIGGGTPSLFSAAGISDLLSGIEKIAPFDNAIEITLEANPGTFEQNKFRDFRQAGINRLSIGIQSFDGEFLRRLGRIHDGGEARKAVNIARQAGFDNFNLDLMFGLPGQSVGQAMDDLATAIGCQPPHLSWYQLTIEPNTAFYSKPPALPEHDLISDMQETGIALMADNALDRYEVSAFSKHGKQSFHNKNYWQFGDYLGIGAGAHGKITLMEDNRIIRTRKLRQPGSYLAKKSGFTAGFHAVDPEELPLEFMMNALRLSEGTDESLFEARTGLALASIDKPIGDLRAKKLLRENRLAATEKGLLFLNDVLAEFLPRHSRHDTRIPLNSV